MNTSILIAKNLEKSYGEVHAVQGMSFEIMRGEIFGLLGPNGAGKTTTISMLTSLLEPTNGEITLNGSPLKENSHALRAKIGFVPQELALYPTLSARDNLRFFGRIYGLRGKKLKERVDAVLDLVGLSKRANDAIETYSGGMKRRINIAPGLLHEPEILFLDEPTVGVDPQSRNAIFESVEKLNAEGLTIIYTTHYMEAAERLCDRIAIVDHGKIIALDTPKNLIQSLGGGLLRVGLHNGKMEEVLQIVSGQPNVNEAWRHDGQMYIRVKNSQAALVDLLDTTNTIDAKVTALEILEPNLETAFLQLTGKRLRD